MLGSPKKKASLPLRPNIAKSQLRNLGRSGKRGDFGRIFAISMIFCLQCVCKMSQIDNRSDVDASWFAQGSMSVGTLGVE